MTDPLTDAQRQRLAVLYATRDALHVEMDAFDLVQCAHWVATGRGLPAVDLQPSRPDEAMWSPERDDIVDRIAEQVDKPS